MIMDVGNDALDGEFCHTVVGGDGVFRYDGLTISRTILDKAVKRRSDTRRTLRCGTCSAIINKAHSKSEVYYDYYDMNKVPVCKRCKQISARTANSRLVDAVEDFVDNRIVFHVNSPPKVRRTEENDLSTVTSATFASPYQPSRTEPPDMEPMYAGALTWAGGRNFPRSPPRANRSVASSSSSTTSESDYSNYNNAPTHCQTNTHIHSHLLAQRQFVKTSSRKEIDKFEKVDRKYLQFLETGPSFRNGNVVDKPRHTSASVANLLLSSTTGLELVKKISGCNNTLAVQTLKSHSDRVKSKNEYRPLYQSVTNAEDRPHYISAFTSTRARKMKI